MSRIKNRGVDPIFSVLLLVDNVLSKFDLVLNAAECSGVQRNGLLDLSTGLPRWYCWQIPPSRWPRTGRNGRENENVKKKEKQNLPEMGGELVVLERQFSIAVYRVLEVAVAEWYQTERLSASFNGCD